MQHPVPCPYWHSLAATKTVVQEKTRYLTGTPATSISLVTLLLCSRLVPRSELPIKNQTPVASWKLVFPVHWSVVTTWQVVVTWVPENRLLSRNFAL